MIVSTNSTEKHSLPIYKTNITWSEIHTYSSLYLIELKASSSTETVHEVRKLVHKLVNVVNVKRVRAVAARFPNLHWIDFQIELPSGTELSDEAWNNVQNLVMDYEWQLRDVTKEKWYFHAQVVNRLFLLEDAIKVIADSDAKQSAELSIRTWSSPPLKFVVH